MAGEVALLSNAPHREVFLDMFPVAGGGVRTVEYTVVRVTQ